MMRMGRDVGWGVVAAVAILLPGFIGCAKHATTPAASTVASATLNPADAEREPAAPTCSPPLRASVSGVRSRWLLPLESGRWWAQ